MDADRVVENLNLVFKEIVKKRPSDAKGEFVKSVALSSTMGPGVHVDLRDNQ